MKRLLLLTITLLQIAFSHAQEDYPYHTTTSYYYNQSTPSDYISDEDFRLLLLKIKQQPVPSTKRVMAKRIATSYALTSIQVYKLCKALPSNTDRLAIAKQCYIPCVDQENYEVVFETLTNKYIADQLSNYIASCDPIEEDDNNEHHPYPNNSNCRKPMSQTAFEGAKQTIEAASFDETKLETAKTIANTNCITTDQVIEICGLFSFEKTKLDFAKYAYSHCYDKNNYFKVGTVFSFDASKTELNKFIQGEK